MAAASRFEPARRGRQAGLSRSQAARHSQHRRARDGAGGRTRRDVPDRPRLSADDARRGRGREGIGAETARGHGADLLRRRGPCRSGLSFRRRRDWSRGAPHRLRRSGSTAWWRARPRRRHARDLGEAHDSGHARHPPGRRRGRRSEARRDARERDPRRRGLSRRRAPDHRRQPIRAPPPRRSSPRSPRRAA